MDRRTLLQLLLAGSALSSARVGRAAQNDVSMKRIPGSGQAIPAIGMGTFRAFEIGNDPSLRDERTRVLEAFFDKGGVLVDCSPMYGVAEEVIGHGLRTLGKARTVMASTKVWNATAGEGRVQLEKSLRLWSVDTIDIYMVHNVENWDEHADVLKDHKARGRIRYLGVSTSHGRRHSELERLMETQPLDFVQLTYNIADREADDRLLPLARDKGIAVMANRPFQGGELFRRVGHQRLPEWAGELGCANWAQILLKYVVSHPAVTCAIPGTSQVAHMEENMGALRGPLPDDGMREQMRRHFESLA